MLGINRFYHCQNLSRRYPSRQQRPCAFGKLRVPLALWYIVLPVLRRLRAFHRRLEHRQQPLRRVGKRHLPRTRRQLPGILPAATMYTRRHDDIAAVPAYVQTIPQCNGVFNRVFWHPEQHMPTTTTGKLFNRVRQLAMLRLKLTQTFRTGITVHV
ncbi:MAG: hypothetical protein DDT38_01687 [Firmicutes bacterium]|nr:hypothetical protein [candidate division NPL-UPA2 bacterium]